MQPVVKEKLPMTQQEVANVLGLSRHTINKVEQKALRKFKYYLLQKHKKEDL
jgi:DNA-binding XRE family transcriptional regulator